MKIKPPRTLGKSRIDMLSGPIWNKLPLFALPVAATAVLELFFHSADLAVVGNFTGEAKTVSVAAIGANSPIIALIINLFIGISLGANVVITNCLGHRDTEGVQKAVHTSLSVSLLVGSCLAVFGQLIAAPVLQLINVPSDVFPFALTYLRIYLCGMPVILLYNFEASIFRSVGQTKLPLIALALGGVINVLLNLFFVCIAGMTVDGVALATVLSNAISAAILFRELCVTENADIKVRREMFRIYPASLKRIARIGMPAGLQSAVFDVSNIVIQDSINNLGPVIMAASGAAHNVELVTYFILNSFTQACTTFVGQNYGAGNIKRCRRVLVLCLAEAAVVMTAAVGLLHTFGGSLISLINSDPNPEIVYYGYMRLSIVVCAHLFSMVYEIISGYLRGFFISTAPAVLTMIGVCGVRLAWIKLVFPHYKTFKTIVLAYPISLAITALLMCAALIYFRPAKMAERSLSGGVHAPR